MKTKKMISDVLLNIVSSFIPVIILQLIVLPILAKSLNSDINGLFLTIINLITLVSFSFGNSLNNSRLIRQRDYEKTNSFGDFNVILLIYSAINVVFVFVGIYFYSKNMNPFFATIIVLGSVFLLLREYFFVEFRINLNYYKVLFSNLLLSLGYLIGMAIFKFTLIWQCIYFAGYLCSLFYVLRKNPLLKEGVVKTSLFGSTFKISVILLITAFLSSAYIYIDRLLIYPILGGDSVSVYHGATVIGKLIIMGITPISGVVLSYFSKKDSVENSLFFKVLVASFLIGVVGYFVCIKLNVVALNLLYPSIAKEALAYTNITTATAVISMLTFIISPFLLKFIQIRWQLVLAVFNIIIYLALTVSLLNSYGLKGFCVGALIANAIKVITMIIVFISKNKDQSQPAGNNSPA